MSFLPTFFAMTGLVLTAALLAACASRRPREQRDSHASRFTVLIERRRH